MKKVIGLIIVLLLSYFAIRPLLSFGFFPMHDDTQVARVIVMGNALKNHQFPVRIVSDLGYGLGYPIYNFYGPLPYYFGGIFYMMGIDSLTATKIMFLVGIVGAAMSMYLFILKVKGMTAGIIASIFYTYAPYHAVQIYVRGAVGEFWAYAFFPICTLGLYYIYKSQLSKGFIYTVIGLSGVILSHTLYGYIFSICYVIFVILLFVVYCYKKLKFPIFNYLLPFATSLLLTIFFWLPAFTEMGYTSVSNQISESADYHNHFVCLPQLVDSMWGYGGSTAGCIDGMSFRIGKVHIIFTILTFIAAFIFRSLNQEIFIFVIVNSLIVLISIFNTTSYSTFIWQSIPGFAYIQYPWRFLALTAFGISGMCSTIVSFFSSNIGRIAFSFALIFLCMYINIKLFQPQYIYVKDAKDFETKRELQYRVSKISDEYLPKEIIRPGDETDVLNRPYIKGDSAITIQFDLNTEIYKRIRIESNIAQIVELNQAYFPGWKYFVNNKEIKISLKQGLPNIEIPSGTSLFEAKFENTPVRFWSNLVSLSTLIIIGYTYARKKANTHSSYTGI